MSLSYASLDGVRLVGARLDGARLDGVRLFGARLGGVSGADLAIARTRILPEGDLIGWKKCRANKIVKLKIPGAAKRSHAFGRKCRAEFADVIEVIGGGKAESSVSFFYPGAEVGYDFPVGPVVIRPYGGIGVSISSALVVTDLFPGTPAEAAGFRVIESVDTKCEEKH